MNRSPSLIPSVLSCTLIASLSLLNMSSAWSAPQPQESVKTTANSQSKSTKSKVSKAKASKYKSVRTKTKKSTLAGKAAPVKLQASKELPTPIASSVNKVTTNPYFANQPVTILPLAGAAVTAASLATPSAASSEEPRVSHQPEPVVAASTIPAAAPAEITTTAAAPTLPSLNPPVYGQVRATAVANNGYGATYQPWNAPAANHKNPYQTNQAQPFTLPDPFKLLSLFGSGLKIASPFPALTKTAPTAPAYVAPSYVAPVYVAAANNPPAYSTPTFSLPALSLPALSLPTFNAPTFAAANYGSSGSGAPSPAQPARVSQSEPASTSNGIASLFSSLKMMIPLTGDANILPTIKKVYPTGEKPLVVLNFKCPTEVIGITPPPMKLLHEAVNLGFDGLNKTNLLSFNLQQVCS